MSEEEFFIFCMLNYGPPEPSASEYYHTCFEYGTRAYLTYDERGRKFTQCVIQCGEAKYRVGKWYYRYIKWFHKQQRGDQT